MNIFRPQQPYEFCPPRYRPWFRPVLHLISALAAIGGSRAPAQPPLNPATMQPARFSHPIRWKRDPGHQHTSHKLRPPSIRNVIDKHIICEAGLLLALLLLSTGCLTPCYTDEELARKRERVRDYLVEHYSDWEPPKYQPWGYPSGGWGGSPNIDIGEIDFGGFCPGSGVGCPGK